MPTITFPRLISSCNITFYGYLQNRRMLAASPGGGGGGGRAVEYMSEAPYPKKHEEHLLRSL